MVIPMVRIFRAMIEGWAAGIYLCGGWWSQGLAETLARISEGHWPGFPGALRFRWFPLLPRLFSDRWPRGSYRLPAFGLCVLLCGTPDLQDQVPVLDPCKSSLFR